MSRDFFHVPDYVPEPVLCRKCGGPMTPTGDYDNAGQAVYLRHECTACELFETIGFAPSQGRAYAAGFTDWSWTESDRNDWRDDYENLPVLR